MIRSHGAAWTAAALLLLLTGCAGEGPDGGAGEDAGAADPDAPAASPSLPDTGVSDGESPTGAAPIPGLPQILSRPYERDGSGKLLVLDAVPPATDTVVEAVPNRHDPAVTDTIRTLRWPGLELNVHVAHGKEILASVRVTDDAYATDEGLRVGLPRQRVRELLGEPLRTGDGAWTYELYEDEHDPLPTTLEVQLANGTVSALTWHYYVD